MLITLLITQFCASLMFEVKLLRFFVQSSSSGQTFDFPMGDLGYIGLEIKVFDHVE